MLTSGDVDCLLTRLPVGSRGDEVICEGCVVHRRRGPQGLMFIDLELPHSDKDFGDAAGAKRKVQLVIDSESDVRARGVLLFAGVTVSATGHAACDRLGSLSIYPTCLRILRQVPEPAAIARTLDAASSTLSPEEVSEALSCDTETLRDLLQLHEQARATGGEPLRRALVAHARAMRGLPPKKEGRQRAQHLKRSDLEVLEAAEESSRQLRYQEAPAEATLSAPANDAEELFALHLPVPPETASARGPRSRGEYLHGKKGPQIVWFLNRLRRVSGTFSHILDVGGGRGDLGRSIAAAFPEVWVTVLDSNAVSLNDGAAHARELGLTNIEFICGSVVDASTLLAHAPLVDFVVALHACGGLSDAALSFAAERAVPFLICPCCYSKHIDLVPGDGWLCFPAPPCASGASHKAEEREVLCRLAEGTSREVAVRSARVINSRRLWASSRKFGSEALCLSFSFFPEALSLRNLVLEGQRPV